MKFSQPIVVYIVASSLVGAASGIATPCLACTVIPGIAAFLVYTESKARLPAYGYAEALRKAAMLGAASVLGFMLGSLVMPVLMTVPFVLLTLSGKTTWSDTILTGVSQWTGALLYALLAAMVILTATTLVAAATLAVLKGRAKANVVNP